MSDKSLTLDAAAEIDRYTQQSIEKINENANSLFSRIIAANSEALSAARDLENSEAITPVDSRMHQQLQQK